MRTAKQQPPVAHEIALALHLLDEARRHAVFASADRWEYAIPVATLLDQGVLQEHISWMDRVGWIELGYEVSQPNAARRVFANSLRTNQPVNWCAVLTSFGEVAARTCANVEVATSHQVRKVSHSKNGHGKLAQSVQLNGANGNGHSSHPASNGVKVVSPTPEWNPRTRELSIRGQLIKRFRGRAPNQVKILTAFQEEGWPSAIDDPLPPRDELDAKRRLHDTIKALNRNQVRALLKFHGNGTGEVITWEAQLKRR